MKSRFAHNLCALCHFINCKVRPYFISDWSTSLKYQWIYRPKKTSGSFATLNPYYTHIKVTIRNFFIKNCQNTINYIISLCICQLIIIYWLKLEWVCCTIVQNALYFPCTSFMCLSVSSWLKPVFRLCPCHYYECFIVSSIKTTKYVFILVRRCGVWT